MRLREIQQTIDLADLSNSASFSQGAKMSDGSPGGQIVGAEKLRRSLTLLASIPGLERYATRILSHPVLVQHTEGTVVLPLRLYEELNGRVTDLIKFTEALRKLIAAAIPPTPAQSISVQIPQPESFEHLATTAASIDKLFRILAQVEVDGEPIASTPPHIAAFDSGSYWFEVALDTGLMVTLIGTVTRAAYELLLKHQQYMSVALVLDSTRIQLKDKDSAQKFNEQVRQELANHIAAQLQKSHFSKSSAESISAIRQAIVEQSKLINQGIEMIPKLTATPEEQSAFPTQEERALLHEAKEKLRLLSEDSTTKEATDTPDKKTGTT